MTAPVELLALSLPFLFVYLTLWLPLKYAGRRRHYKRFGYLDVPFDAPRAAFGTVEHEVRRDGNRGHFRGMVISNNPNFYSRERMLEARVDEQAGAPCEVCGRPCENDLRRSEGPAFVEQWMTTYVLFAPINRYHDGFEAYCHRHVPRDFAE